MDGSLEERLVDELISAMYSTGDLNYNALDLVERDYDVEKFAQRVIRKGEMQRVGYLLETVVAALQSDLDLCSRYADRAQVLAKLSDRLYNGLGESGPVHMIHMYPSADMRMRSLLQDSIHTDELNRKWGVYSALKPSELETWFVQYLLRGAGTHG